ncbi:MAG: 2-hydroxyacid dehydrogenase [Pseudobdellovibrionaceae bacterium]
MKVAVFDTHKFDKHALTEANSDKHELLFLETRLNEKTALLAQTCEAVCCFANDKCDQTTLTILKKSGIKLIALRSAGYNHVDIHAALGLGLTVVRVPEYSPYAVAEHAVGLLLTLNRKIHRAHNRVREMNFSLDGFVGFDLHGKTVGVIGTGRIGKTFAQIMAGFGCKVLAFDKDPNIEWSSRYGVMYTDLNSLLKQSRVISLHIPLTQGTKHLIDSSALACMGKETILINTGRGALIDSKALIQCLKSHAIAGACLDVYEEEAGIFFSDLSDSGIDDDLLARLLTFPNVLITSHQAFLTEEALHNIAATTIDNITRFEQGANLSTTQVTS